MRDLEEEGQVFELVHVLFLFNRRWGAFQDRQEDVGTRHICMDFQTLE
jgi:hypothetical protein